MMNLAREVSQPFTLGDNDEFMLLTITNTQSPANDLGYLLHKNPERELIVSRYLRYHKRLANEALAVMFVESCLCNCRYNSYLHATYVCQPCYLRTHQLRNRGVTSTPRCC